MEGSCTWRDKARVREALYLGIKKEVFVCLLFGWLVGLIWFGFGFLSVFAHGI